MSFYDKVHTTPLTPHLFLALLHDEDHRVKLVSTLHAVRKAVYELQAFYGNLSRTVEVPERLPVLGSPAPWPLWMNQQGEPSR